MRAVTLSGRPATRQDITSLLAVADDVARPSLKSDQVLVKVLATALNIEDIMSGVGRRIGVSLTPTKEDPVVLGQEFAGVVEEVGSKVRKFTVGDSVLGHKMPFRVRLGSWAEYVSVGESCLVHKPPSYSFSQAAALPMSALVAWGAVKAGGHINKPVLDNLEHKHLTPAAVEVEESEHNPSLLVKRGTDINTVLQAKVGIVGASSTTGLIMVDMLVSRGVQVVGVSSASSAATVLSNGAVGVLDRNRGGLEAKGDLALDLIIDCVGGQDIEDAARKALLNKGHFVTIMGPGTGSFGDGGDGAKQQLSQGMKIASRSLMSMFSSTKYTQAAMPMTGGTNILEQLLNENIKSVVDSEVEMFNEEAMIAAVNKVNSHKTKGRLVFTVQ